MEEETLLHASSLAGIIVQKITANLLTKDPGAQRISATGHQSDIFELCAHKMHVTNAPDLIFLVVGTTCAHFRYLQILNGCKIPA